MSNETKGQIISEATPVRIGLIIAFLSLFGGGVWWASSITSKLDSILSFQKTTDSAMIELKAKDIALDKEIAETKLKFALLEVDVKTIKDKLLSIK